MRGSARGAPSDRCSYRDCLIGSFMIKSEVIWHEYHTKLAAFIRSKVSDDLVDDILQDIFMKVHVRIDSLKEDEKLESWLYQIARNTITDYYRSRRTIKDIPEWMEQSQPEEDEIIRGKLSLCLKPMINKLPEKYRNAIQLSEIENKRQKDVAEREDISLSASKSRVQRGRSLLKRMLNDCCQFEINRRNQVVSYEEKGKAYKCC